MAHAFANTPPVGWSAQQPQKVGTGYPPFDVERMRACGEAPEILRITVAVAGFCAADLALTLDDGRLTLTGRRLGDDVERTFLHRGVAMRGFQRSFALDGEVAVLGANLRDGLLTIDLARREKRSVNKVEIAVRS